METTIKTWLMSNQGNRVNYPSKITHRKYGLETLKTNSLFDAAFEKCTSLSNFSFSIVK